MAKSSLHSQFMAESRDLYFDQAEFSWFVLSVRT